MGARRRGIGKGEQKNLFKYGTGKRKILIEYYYKRSYNIFYIVIHWEATNGIMVRR